MNKSREIRTGRHCVFLRHVRLVFVMKYRKPVFRAQHLNLNALETKFSKIFQDFNAELVEFN